MHIQKRERHAKRSKTVAKRENLCAGDSAGAPTGNPLRGRFGRNVAKQEKLCVVDSAAPPQQKNPLAHYFATALSKIKRKPSSVSCEFVSVMVLDALATRGARPPVATTGAV